MCSCQFVGWIENDGGRIEPRLELQHKQVLFSDGVVLLHWNSLNKIISYISNSSKIETVGTDQLVFICIHIVRYRFKHHFCTKDIMSPPEGDNSHKLSPLRCLPAKTFHQSHQPVQWHLLSGQRKSLNRLSGKMQHKRHIHGCNDKIVCN